MVHKSWYTSYGTHVMVHKNSVALVKGVLWCPVLVVASSISCRDVRSHVSCGDPEVATSTHDTSFATTNMSSLALVNGVVTALSHALWRFLSLKVIWVLGHVQMCRLWVRHSPCCTWFLINCFGIEMVLCDVYLERFDITKGLSFDIFSVTVWYKLCRYDHSKVGIIFSTNVLVDGTRLFNLNATRFKQK